MILEQLPEKFPAADYIHLYDLDQNFLYGGVIKIVQKCIFLVG